MKNTNGHKTERAEISVWPACSIPSIRLPVPNGVRLAGGRLEAPNGVSWSEMRLRETYLRVVARMAIEDDRACLILAEAFGWPARADQASIDLEVLRDELRTLRDAVRLYDYVSGHSSLEQALHGWETKACSPATRDDAVDLLAGWLDAALGAVRFHSWVQRLYSSQPDQSHATLLTAFWLELANHVTERAVYRTCSNPACGHLFVTHEGRVAGTRSRGDADYCSYSCSKVHSQKKYRADVRTARTLASEGKTVPHIAILLGREESLVRKWISGDTRV